MAKPLQITITLESLDALEALECALDMYQGTESERLSDEAKDLKNASTKEQIDHKRDLRRCEAAERLLKQLRA